VGGWDDAPRTQTTCRGSLRMSYDGVREEHKKSLQPRNQRFQGIEANVTTVRAAEHAHIHDANAS
jgi:hypothetical protein